MELKQWMAHRITQRLTFMVFAGDTDRLAELEVRVAHTYRDAVLGEFKDIIDKVPALWVDDYVEIYFVPEDDYGVLEWGRAFRFGVSGGNKTMRMPKIGDGNAFHERDAAHSKEFNEAYRQYKDFNGWMQERIQECTSKLQDMIMKYETVEDLVSASPALGGLLPDIYINVPVATSSCNIDEELDTEVRDILNSVTHKE